MAKGAARGTAKGAAKKAGTARTPGTRSTAGMGEGMPRAKGGGGLPNEIYPSGPASGGTNTAGLPGQVYPGTSASGKPPSKAMRGGGRSSGRSKK